MSKINMYFKQITNNVRLISKETDKNKIILFLDIIISTVIFGSSPNNYLEFKFFELPFSVRKTYLTHRDSEKIIKGLNNKSIIDQFEDKITFAKLFEKYFNRDWLDNVNLMLME